MVSVVFHDTTSTASAFLRKNGDLWPAVSDPGGSIAERYGVTAPPTTFVIDPSGAVTAVLEGPATAAEPRLVPDAPPRRSRRAASSG